MDPLAFEHVVEVVEADLDDLGHVNNAVYLAYVEAASRAHALRQGLDLAAFRAAGAVPVVRGHRVRYHHPARLGERLRVGTRVTGMDGVRATRRNEVRRVSDGVLLVEVETEWVWLDERRGRPRRVPTDVQDAFGWPRGRRD